jgi:hypothetical protein
MKLHGLPSSAFIGVVASARSMTPMASIAAARLLDNRMPGRLVLLDGMARAQKDAQRRA